MSKVQYFSQTKAYSFPHVNAPHALYKLPEMINCVIDTTENCLGGPHFKFLSR